MQEMFDIVLRMSVQGIVIFAIVFSLRFLLKKIHVAHKYIVILWMVLFFYLVFPWKIEMPVGFWQDSILTESNVKNEDIFLYPNAYISDGFDISVGAGSIHNWEMNAYTANQITLSGEISTEVLREEHAGTTETTEIFARIKEVITYIWLIIGFGLVVHFITSFIMIKRKLAVCINDRDNIYLAQDIRTPMVFGVVRPCIYLPLHLDEENRYYVLAHEQMHIKRRDYIIKIVVYMICIMHWFNPVIWLAYHLFGSDVEKACDEAVVRTLGVEKKKEYVNALLLAATDKLNKERMIFTAPICFDKGDVKGRVKNIVKYKYTLPIVGAMIVVIALVLAVVFLTKGEAKISGTNENIVTEQEGDVGITEDNSSGTESTETMDEGTVITDPYYIDSETMRRVGFHDLLGYDGYFIIRKDSVPMENTYYAVEEDETFIIAKSYGFEREDYYIDLDEDGVRELVCNVCYGTGAQDVLIYCRFEDGIRVAYGSSLLDEEYDNIGSGSIVAWYDVIYDRVEIAYWDADLQNYRYKNYDLDLDAIPTWYKPDIPENGVFTLKSMNFYADDMPITVAAIGKKLGAYDLYGVKEIDIYANDSLIQTIVMREAIEEDGTTTIEDGYTECYDKEEVIDLKDINSDGYQDLEVFAWDTEDSPYYYYYCWNPVNQFFEYAFCNQVTDVNVEN